MKYCSLFRVRGNLLSSLRYSLSLSLFISLFWGNINPSWADNLFSASSPTLSYNRSFLISNASLPSAVAEAVKQDVTRRHKIPTSELKIKTFSRETWSNGCLGLGNADEICTMALVEGYRVVVTHEKHTWTYRTDSMGLTVRVESPS